MLTETFSNELVSSRAVEEKVVGIHVELCDGLTDYHPGWMLKIVVGCILLVLAEELCFAKVQELDWQQSPGVSHVPQEAVEYCTQLGGREWSFVVVRDAGIVLI